MAFLILLIVAILILAVRRASFASWTGFGDYTTPTGEFIRGKTLWDWFQLLVIPLSLLIGGYLLNRSEREIERQRAEARSVTEQKRAEERANLEREIAMDRQREVALQAYLDRMTELLLKENLRTSENEEVRNVARIRTLTVLRSLDGMRRREVLLFLRESRLITMPAIIELRGAVLEGVSFSDDDLSEIKLSGADLSSAYMGQCRLRNADLSGANMSASRLDLGNLEKANLSNATLILSKLNNANFLRANLHQAMLNGAELREAILVHANLCEADLGAIFFPKDSPPRRAGDLITQVSESVSTISTDLTGADISGADMTGANLERALLCKANLTDANLSNANLNDADLSDAILFGAVVTESQLAQAKTLKGAFMPDGTKHE
jgi:uncharacterized protein YjbI with pentapeptide repeats